MPKGLWILLLPLMGSAAAISCGGNAVGDRTGSEQPRGTVLVFAAASLTDAFTEIESAFELANPDVEVEVNLAGSSALREQILEGAPADVFASANEANMVKLVDAGEVRHQPDVFGHNPLQIAVPAGNGAGISGLGDFAEEELLIGLCAEGVPCGDLAREVLGRAEVEVSIDTNEPDVRALLTRIGADELDAGLVYVTDVLGADGLVEGIVIPADLNVRATYSIAALAASPNPEGAAAFTRFVVSDEGRAILSGYGFGLP